MAAALNEETVALLDQLRATATMGNTIKAALTEGKLQMLDEVLGIFTRFAEKAKSHQE